MKETVSPVRFAGPPLILGALALALALCAPVTGCGKVPKGPRKLTRVRIGAVPQEDALPFFVAAQGGHAKSEGLDLKVVTYDDAAERDAALADGQLEGIVGDVVSAARLADGGTSVRIISVVLGADPTEGRFGIVVPKSSRVRTAIQLRGVPVAAAPRSLCEYAVDRLLMEQGLSVGEISRVDGAKDDQVRASRVVAGKVPAAGLSDPFLYLAQSRGARLIIDDTRGRNLTQSTLILHAAFADKDSKARESLVAVQARAAGAINQDPEKYRGLLVRTAGLPSAIADSYRLNAYPAPALPKRQDVDDVLDWMRGRGMLARWIDYASLTSGGSTVE